MADERKICCTCQRDVPLSLFNRRAAARDGLQSRCRDCASVWYQENRSAHVANVRRRNDRVRAELHQLLAAYLAEHPCVDCGERDIRCLEFDHRDPTTKLYEISQLLRLTLSRSRMLAEIDKCDVRCANCHRRVTVERGGYWRQAVHERLWDELSAQTTARLHRVLRVHAQA